MEAATAARAALRTAATPPVPAGLLDEVRAEAERMSRAQGSVVRPIGEGRTARWQRVASVVGVAAAVVIVATLALPRLGDAPSTGAEEPAAVDAAQPERAVALEVSDRDYDVQSAGALADSFAAAPQDAAGSLQTAAVATGESSSFAAGGDLDAAVGCLRSAFGELPGQPVRVIRARFEGTPAYLGVFHVGPGADQPPTESRVVIAATEDCSVLGSATAVLRE